MINTSKQLREIRPYLKQVGIISYKWMCGCIVHHLINDEWLPTKTCKQHRPPRNPKVLTLSKKDQEVFAHNILNPPEPNDKLKAAAEDFKKCRMETCTKDRVTYNGILVSFCKDHMPKPL